MKIRILPPDDFQPTKPRYQLIDDTGAHLQLLTTRQAVVLIIQEDVQVLPISATKTIHHET